MIAVSIRDDVDQIKRLEDLLIGHCVESLNEYGVQALVDGVFSLDHLESMMEKDLNGLVGVGVGYQGLTNDEPTRANANADPRGVFMGDFTFLVMLAVPTDAILSQRLSATKLLAALRFGILGKQVEFAQSQQRTWQFVQEKSEVEESTATMLYYTQVWRLKMPVKGK